MNSAQGITPKVEESPYFLYFSVKMRKEAVNLTIFMEITRNAI